jgi:hypothetical protein
MHGHTSTGVQRVPPFNPKRYSNYLLSKDDSMGFHSFAFKIVKWMQGTTMNIEAIKYTKMIRFRAQLLYKQNEFFIMCRLR